MSKGIFAQLRTPTAKNPHPVLMTPQVSVTSVETLFAAVAGFSILVKSNVAANRPAESTLAGLIEASFSVTRISASAAYSCSNFCSMVVLDN